MKSLGHGLGLFTLLFVGALFACDFEMGEDVARNTCKRSSDCGAGTCSDDGYCVADSVPKMEIAYAISPDVAPATWEGIPLVLQVPSEEIEGPGSTDFDLPPLATVYGRVRLGSSTVPALVTLTGPEIIPSTPPVVTQAQTTNSTVAADGLEADYSASVALGGTLRVRVTPIGVPLSAPSDLRAYQGDVALPPLETEITLSSTSMRVDFVYATDIWSPCTASRRESCALTLDFEKTAGSSPLLSLDDLSVVAVASDGTVISSYDRIHDGTATIRLGPASPTGADGGVYIRVAASTQRDDFVGHHDVFPTMRVGPVDVGAPAPIVLPVIEPVNYVARVENQNANLVGGATVRFAARSLGNGFVGDVAFEQVATSASAGMGAEGTFQVSLFPGEYDVLVTPPTGAPYGVLLSTVSVLRPPVGNDVAGQVFELPSRSELSGVVSTFSGLAANNVMLRAEPFPTSGVRPATSTSNVYGEFSMTLDHGDYDLVVVPSGFSNFARQIIPGVSSATPVSIVLAPPIVRSGVVRASDGSPVPGAIITAYRVIRGFVDRSVIAGYALADEHGAYTLLLAP